jgi:hypothetical protein
MKIRTDYVSNSSSSSFMVVGKVFTSEDLVDIAKHNKFTTEEGGDPENENYEDWDSYDIISALEEKFPDLDIHYGIEDFYDEYCIGMDYEKMKSDETRKDFEGRIAKQLSDMYGKEIKKVDCLVDGGREG